MKLMQEVDDLMRPVIQKISQNNVEKATEPIKRALQVQKEDSVLQNQKTVKMMKQLIEEQQNNADDFKRNLQEFLEREIHVLISKFSRQKSDTDVRF
jgi:predicted methyltransferase